MDRHRGVDDGARRHGDGAAAQIGFGGGAVHPPGQGGVAAKGFLVDKVAPAADALADQKAHAGQVQHGGHRDFAPAAGQPAEDDRADDAAVNGKAALADVQHIPDAVVGKGRHGHIVHAGADDGHDHAHHDDVGHGIAVDAELGAVAEREQDGQHDAGGDQHAVPVDVHAADGESHPVDLKAEAQPREGDKVRHRFIPPFQPRRAGS